MIRMIQLAVLASACFLAPLSAQESPRLRVDLNIPTLRVAVYEGDRLVRSYPVAVGQIGHETPEGTFTISRAEWNPSWHPPAREWAKDARVTPPGPNNPMGRVKLFFAPLYYIHGTPDRASLGTPASHGCVRMLNEDAVALGTLLHDRGRPSIPRESIPSILARPRTTRVSRFHDSLTFVIRYDPVVVEGGDLVVYPDLYRRGAVHPEAVYQALIAAGYDISALGREEVAEFVARARRAKGILKIGVPQAFGDRVRLGAVRG